MESTEKTVFRRTVSKPLGKKKNPEQFKRLSKAGEFMKKYPNGFLTIVDMKAVMK
ncbi:MAG: hypothetical protein LBR52_05535 [Prevotellaceae bacterium]|jgi:hypothetical protein|nr:hypothetical protein [Prevotellaceae bacterium]